MLQNNSAGVVKLVDAEDSKSSGPCARVGSIPTSGTKQIKGADSSWVGPFFVYIKPPTSCQRQYLQEHVEKIWALIMLSATLTSLSLWERHSLAQTLAQTGIIGLVD